MSTRDLAEEFAEPGTAPHDGLRILASWSAEPAEPASGSAAEATPGSASEASD